MDDDREMLRGIRGRYENASWDRQHDNMLWENQWQWRLRHARRVSTDHRREIQSSNHPKRRALQRTTLQILKVPFSASSILHMSLPSWVERGKRHLARLKLSSRILKPPLSCREVSRIRLCDLKANLGWGRVVRRCHSVRLWSEGWNTEGREFNLPNPQFLKVGERIEGCPLRGQVAVTAVPSKPDRTALCRTSGARQGLPCATFYPLDRRAGPCIWNQRAPSWGNSLPRLINVLFQFLVMWDEDGSAGRDRDNGARECNL